MQITHWPFLQTDSQACSWTLSLACLSFRIHLSTIYAGPEGALDRTTTRRGGWPEGKLGRLCPEQLH